MKIGMPVNNIDMDGDICVSFGRAPYFLIYDEESKESTFVENIGAKASGGAGVKAAQLIVDNNVDILLTPRCGENAAAVFQVANIKIYKTNGTSIKENIDLFIGGKLSLLEEIHEGFHGGN